MARPRVTEPTPTEDLEALMGAGRPGQLRLAELVPWDENPRDHDPDQVAMLVKSIRAHGMIRPVMVQEGSNRIVAGHGTRLALLEIAAGADPRVPVVFCRLSDAQARSYAIADNRLSDLSVWNPELLRSSLAALNQDGFDFGALGFTPDALAEIFAPPPPGSGILPGVDPDDAPPLPAIPTSRLGDLYMLGNHRLLVGDSTSKEDVARLMDGAQADMLLTDPPYGVAYKLIQGPKGPKGRKKAAAAKAAGTDRILNDELDPEALEAFLVHVFGNAAESISSHAGCYIFHPSLYGREFLNALNACGFEMRSQIIWSKTNASFGWAQYRWQHEPIIFAAKEEGVPLVFVPAHEAAFYAFKAGQSVAWEGDRSQTTVWTFGQGCSHGPPEPEAHRPSIQSHPQLHQAARNRPRSFCWKWFHPHGLRGAGALLLHGRTRPGLRGCHRAPLGTGDRQEGHPHPRSGIRGS